MDWSWIKLNPPGMDRTAAGLLNAIAANPADDTSRFVFADYLEENGNAEWAAFIRRQCRDHALWSERSVNSPVNPPWHKNFYIVGRPGSPATFTRLFETGPWRTPEFVRACRSEDWDIPFVCMRESEMRPHAPLLYFHRGFCTGFSGVNMWTLVRLIRAGWAGWHVWSPRPHDADTESRYIHTSWWPYNRISIDCQISWSGTGSSINNTWHMPFAVWDRTAGKWRTSGDRRPGELRLMPGPVVHFLTDPAMISELGTSMIPEVSPDNSRVVFRFGLGIRELNVAVSRFVEAAAAESRRRVIEGE